MAAGAANGITKPRVGLKGFLQQSAAKVVKRLLAARPKPLCVPCSKHLDRLRRCSADVICRSPVRRWLRQPSGRRYWYIHRRTQALEQVLVRLPRVCLDLVIVQHMPEKFTASFALAKHPLRDQGSRSAKQRPCTTGNCADRSGWQAYDAHRSGAFYQAQVLDGTHINRHRPSVDVLFDSVARFAGRNATGILMTGMGGDGARGLKKMFHAGAETFAQNEASCVVFGIEAPKLGGVSYIVTLNDIGLRMLEAVGVAPDPLNVFKKRHGTIRAADSQFFI
jgi:two-component system chemotaxis response regulator CheB